MQRQKTIAKWLAVILLLTSVIACYVAFSTIIKNKNAAPDIAGADADNNGANLDPDGSEDLTKPVYSAFPRSAETVDTKSVAHVGGEDNEIFLHTLYYSGKRYVFFYSASAQYDVKECGIHIAVFKDAALLSTIKIAGAEETFICASVVENGFLVITKNAAQTKLRLLGSDLQALRENVCPLYSDYKLYVTSAGVRLYMTDDRYIYAGAITDSLEIRRSNLVHPIENGKIVYVAGLPSFDMIFVQSPVGVGLISYTSAGGFSYVNELAGCRLLQVLPIAQNGAPSLTLLAKANDGIRILNVDGSLKTTDSYLFKNARTAVALPLGNNICVVADGVKALFCSHLELQSSNALAFSEYSQNDSYEAIDGERNCFIISQDNKRFIVKLENDSLKVVTKLVGKNLSVVRDSVGGKSGLAALFDGNINNDFAYMCFGAADVFYIFEADK